MIRNYPDLGNYTEFDNMALILYCITLVNFINAKIIGAFVLPHGGIALDPNFFTNGSNATTLQEA